MSLDHPLSTASASKPPQQKSRLLSCVCSACEKEDGTGVSSSRVLVAVEHPNVNHWWPLKSVFIYEFVSFLLCCGVVAEFERPRKCSRSDDLWLQQLELIVLAEESEVAQFFLTGGRHCRRTR